MPPPLPSAHAWAQPSKLDMLCATFLPAMWLPASLPLQPALSSPLQCQVHPKYRLAVSR